MAEYILLFQYIGDTMANISIYEGIYLSGINIPDTNENRRPSILERPLFTAGLFVTLANGKAMADVGSKYRILAKTKSLP